MEGFMNKHKHFELLRNIIFILFTCSISITSVKLFAQELLNLEPLPGIQPVPEYLVPGSGQSYAGLATYYMGRPVILYDNIWMQRIGGLGSPAFRFIRAHEYAHIMRGHLIPLMTPSAIWPIVQYQSEVDADCTAVRYLKQIGDLEAVEAGAQVYSSVLPPQDMDNRPGAYVRLNIIQSC